MTGTRTRIEKRRDDRQVSRQRAEQPHADPGPQRNKSWEGTRKGNGGEGFSKGYGGSGGDGTGPSGPETGTGRRR